MSPIRRAFSSARNVPTAAVLTGKSSSRSANACIDGDLSGGLEDHRETLSPADAGAREAEPLAAPAELFQERQHETRAGGPERMAERDRAPVDVQPRAIEP